MVLAKPGSITPHTKFKAEVYVLTKDEGGRHTPFFTNYRPQFYFRTSDVTGTLTLPEGVEMVMPGDNVSVTVELQKTIAMEKGLEVRDPRRRSHHRFRHCDGSHRLIANTVSGARRLNLRAPFLSDEMTEMDLTATAVAQLVE